MTVSYPMFLAIICGILFLAVSSVVTAVLNFRFRLARGIRDIVFAILVPVILFGLAALLTWANPVDGEYKVGIWFIPPSLLGPFIGLYDLFRVFKRRREAQEEAERAARRPSYDLSKVRLPNLE
jgi:hypothetical protein